MKESTIYKMMELTQNQPKLGFNWDLAYVYISNYKMLSDYGYAEACLIEDYYETKGVIHSIEEGFITKSGAFLSSTWATPTLIIYDTSGEIIKQISCFKRYYDSEKCKNEWPKDYFEQIKGRAIYSGFFDVNAITKE